jgi:hypothetical protein
MPILLPPQQILLHPRGTGFQPAPAAYPVLARPEIATARFLWVARLPPSLLLLQLLPLPPLRSGRQTQSNRHCPAIRRCLPRRL